MERFIKVCPHCDHGNYFLHDYSYICLSCKKEFNSAKITMNDGSILKHNEYFNISLVKDLLLIDGLSISLLEKLNNVLISKDNMVTVNIHELQIRLKIFKDTDSEYSKLRLLKVGEDYLDHDETFKKIRDLLDKNEPFPLNVGALGTNIKIPVYLTVSDIYDLEELTYNLDNELKTNSLKDSEVDALMTMFDVINDQIV